MSTLDKLSFRTAIDSDFPEILKISHRQLGAGYVSSETLLFYITNGLAVVAESSDFLVGFILGSTINQNELNKTLRRKQIVLLSSHKKMGLIKTIVVNPDFVGRGIGSHLIEIAINYFLEKNITKIICVAWKSKTGINVERILEKSLFEQFLEIENYWREESLSSGFCCPACGIPPCLCSAVMFVRIR